MRSLSVAGVIAITIVVSTRSVAADPIRVDQAVFEPASHVVTPEPGTLLLLASGLGCIIARRRTTRPRVETALMGDE